MEVYECRDCQQQHDGSIAAQPELPCPGCAIEAEGEETNCGVPGDEACIDRIADWLRQPGYKACFDEEDIAAESGEQYQEKQEVEQYSCTRMCSGIIDAALRCMMCTSDRRHDG